MGEPELANAEGKVFMLPINARPVRSLDPDDAVVVTPRLAREIHAGINDGIARHRALAADNPPAPTPAEVHIHPTTRITLARPVATETIKEVTERDAAGRPNKIRETTTTTSGPS